MASFGDRQTLRSGNVAVFDGEKWVMESEFDKQQQKESRQAIQGLGDAAVPSNPPPAPEIVPQDTTDDFGDVARQFLVGDRESIISPEGQDFLVGGRESLISPEGQDFGGDIMNILSGIAGGAERAVERGSLPSGADFASGVARSGQALGEMFGTIGDLVSDPSQTGEGIQSLVDQPELLAETIGGIADLSSTVRSNLPQAALDLTVLGNIGKVRRAASAGKKLINGS